MSVAVPAVSGVGELLAEIASGAFVRERDGVTLEDDWDGIGQRLTATGTTCLDDVRVAAEEVILHRPKPPEGEPPDPSYVGVFLQLYLTAVIARSRPRRSTPRWRLSVMDCRQIPVSDRWPPDVRRAHRCGWGRLTAAVGSRRRSPAR